MSDVVAACRTQFRASLIDPIAKDIVNILCAAATAQMLSDTPALDRSDKAQAKQRLFKHRRRLIARVATYNKIANECNNSAPLVGGPTGSVPELPLLSADKLKTIFDLPPNFPYMTDPEQRKAVFQYMAYRRLEEEIHIITHHDLPRVGLTIAARLWETQKGVAKLRQVLDCLEGAIGAKREQCGLLKYYVEQAGVVDSADDEAMEAAGVVEMADDKAMETAEGIRNASELGEHSAGLFRSVIHHLTLFKQLMHKSPLAQDVSAQLAAYEWIGVEPEKMLRQFLALYAMLSGLYSHLEVAARALTSIRTRNAGVKLFSAAAAKVDAYWQAKDAAADARHGAQSPSDDELETRGPPGTEPAATAVITAGVHQQAVDVRSRSGVLWRSGSESDDESVPGSDEDSGLPEFSFLARPRPGRLVDGRPIDLSSNEQSEADDDASSDEEDSDGDCVVVNCEQRFC